MTVVEVIAVAAVAVVLLVLLTYRALRRWRRSEAQVCVSEEEARENAAPLTTAIVSGSRRESRAD